MSLTLKNENGYTYAEEGHGAVVILLHGLMGGPENFAPVIPGLRHVCHVVIPCLPLFELPLRKANVKELVHFLRGFIAYKGYGSVILAGNSLGGHVALLYALKHPEGVRAMVLTGNSGLTENTMGTTIPRRKDYDYVREKAALTFYDPAVATKELVDSVFAVLNDNIQALRLLRMAKSAVRENLGHDLYRLSMPVGLIWGRDDIVTPPEVAEEFHQKLPLSRLSYLDHCGHAPMMEKPEEFSVLFRRYLRWFDQVREDAYEAVAVNAPGLSRLQADEKTTLPAWA